MAAGTSPWSMTTEFSGEIVGKRRGRLEKQRQVVFDSRRDDAIGNILVQRRARRVAFEHFAKAAAKARRPASSSGNSRAGSSRTVVTGYTVRWVSTSKVRIDSISSSKRSMRYGSGLPIGYRSISPPRMLNSPGDTTCVTF